MSFAGVDKVLVVEQGKIVEKTVTFRQRTADWAEVSSGVKIGDAVILEPGNLQAGQPVTMIE